jgi:hypothetical protein
MYQAVQFENLPIFGSTTQWRRLQDLKSWAELQGLSLKREVSKSDGTVTYVSRALSRSIERGCRRSNPLFTRLCCSNFLE